MENKIDIDKVKDELNGVKLAASFTFWEKKRPLFNLIAGIGGLIPILIGSIRFSILDLIGIIAWGVMANAFYNTGYWLESFITVRSKGNSDLRTIRNQLFWIGSLAFFMVDLVIGYLYFHAIV